MEEDVGRVHGVSGEVCWGVGGGMGGSVLGCGERQGKMCGEMVWGRGMGGVGGSVLGCGERQGKMCGEWKSMGRGVGECTGVG